MAGWTTILQLVDLVPTLIRNDLWQEIREAFWERRSALELAPVPAQAVPDRIRVRDPVGSMDAYRMFLQNVVSLVPAGTEFGEEDAEIVPDILTPMRPVKMYVLGSEPGDDELNLFQEALGQEGWTVTGRGWSGGAPFLPRRALWTDFRTLLNRLVFARVHLADAAWSNSGAEKNITGGDTSWAAVRAAAWAGLAYDGVAPGSTVIGRHGLGYHQTSAPHYLFNPVWFFEWVKAALDLSALFEASALTLRQDEAFAEGDGTTGPYEATLDHVPVVPGSLDLRLPDRRRVGDDGEGNLTGAASGTIDYATGDVAATFAAAVPAGDDIVADYESRAALDPVRVVFYVCFESGWRSYWPDDWDPITVQVDLSGDGGASWTSLGTFSTADTDDEKAHYAKFESLDPDLWTADSVLRFSYVGDKAADTPTWTDPGEGSASDYAAEAVILPAYLAIYVEYDWKHGP